MDTIQPIVSFISVNFNGTEMTKDLLNSIQKFTRVPYEVIVVDNGSLENPIPKLSALFPHVKFIRSEENLGFAGGNNLGIEQSSGPFLCLINNDATITESTIPFLMECLEAYPQAGVVSPVICFDPIQASYAKAIIQYAGHTKIHSITGRNRTLYRMTLLENLPEKKPFPTAYAHGAAMMLRREVFEAVGGMSEYFFLYYEELDWCARIRDAGWEILVAPQAVVYHKESSSIGESPMKTYYLNRNRILFMRLHQNRFNIFLFLLYWLVIVTPKSLVVFGIRGKFEHLKAFLEAIKWHYQHWKLPEI